MELRNVPHAREGRRRHVPQVETHALCPCRAYTAGREADVMQSTTESACDFWSAWCVNDGGRTERAGKCTALCAPVTFEHRRIRCGPRQVLERAGRRMSMRRKRTEVSHAWVGLARRWEVGAAWLNLYAMRGRRRPYQARSGSRRRGHETPYMTYFEGFLEEKRWLVLDACAAVRAV